MPGLDQSRGIAPLPFTEIENREMNQEFFLFPRVVESPNCHSFRRFEVQTFRFSYFQNFDILESFGICHGASFGRKELLSAPG